MKKKLALLLSISMLIMALVGCSSEPAPTETPESEAPASEATTEAESTEEEASEDTADGASWTESTWVPDGKITYVVPYDAGGTADIPARIMAQYMTEISGNEVEVVNIVGAGGQTGAKEVMAADPDGQTYLHVAVGLPMQYGLGTADFTYEDFEPTALWMDSSLAIVVNADSPYQTLDDLIAAAEAAPGEILAGSYTGTLPLFAFIDLQQRTGVEFNLVDIQQKAPELLSNRIDTYIDGFGAIKQYVDSGDFRCLAVISSDKIPGYEDIPTYADLGYEDYEYLAQKAGVYAPKGTPTEALQYFNDLLKAATENEDCLAELDAIGFRTDHRTIAEYTEYITATYATFVEMGKLVVG